MKKLYLKTLLAGFFSLSLITTNAQYSWTQKANFPGAARSACTSFSIGHYGYVGSGGDASNAYYDWWRWNQDSNTWTQITSYPGAEAVCCSSFSIGGKGYVGLGYASVVHTDLWQYDTTTNTWTQMANFPGAARDCAFTFVIGTKAYIGCGEPNGTPYYQDVWVYDAVANSWTQVADFPGGRRSNLVAFVLDGYGYVGCGNQSATTYNDMWRYDTTTNTWTSITSMPVTFGGASCFALGDTGYAVSGEHGANQYLHNVFSFDSVNNAWATLSNFPGTARWQGAGFSIGNKGYVACGIDTTSTRLADLWQYAPINTSGINEVSNSNTILVYPNPAKDEVYVQLNGNEKAEMLELYTITGQRVVSNQSSVASSDGTMKIKTSGLEAGIYFLKVQMQDGSTIEKKVEIQN